LNFGRYWPIGSGLTGGDGSGGYCGGFFGFLGVGRARVLAGRMGQRRGGFRTDFFLNFLPAPVLDLPVLAGHRLGGFGHGSDRDGSQGRVQWVGFDP